MCLALARKAELKPLESVLRHSTRNRSCSSSEQSGRQSDITSCPPGASAVGHLVEGSERREDAALVGLHDVSVLDHLVQDDVDSVQVEHDLTPRQRNNRTGSTNGQQEVELHDGRIRPVRSVGTDGSRGQTGS